MTTLVISDLHLGMASRQDLLRRPEVRRRLIERLDGVQRLVLLGDTLELRHGPLRGALAAARPFFEDVGAALRGAEVIVVPGNHDHRLLAGWHERRRAAEAGPLRLEHRIAPHAGEVSGVLARWLGPAALTLAYPGLWLRDDVYATHGHFLDLHSTVPTLERLALGALRVLTGGLRDDPGPDDYDAALSPLYAAFHELAQVASGRRRTDGQAWLLRRYLSPGQGDRPPRLAACGAALPAVVLALDRLGLGPLRPQVTPRDVTAAGLRAMGMVCARLRPAADHVVFGHLHRAGPWPDDDPGAWTAPTGARLVNTGSWVRDSTLSTGPAAGGYSPGTCVEIGATGRPRAVRVLDDLASSSGATGHALQCRQVVQQRPHAAPLRGRAWTPTRQPR